MQRQPNSASSGPALGVAWLFVGIPFVWGVVTTIRNVAVLFK